MWRNDRWAHEALVLRALIYLLFFRPSLGSLRTPPIFGDVRRETKAKTPLGVRTAFRTKAYVIHTLLLCDWSVQQSANKPQNTTNTKGKECCSDVSRSFFGGALRVIPKNGCGGDYPNSHSGQLHLSTFHSFTPNSSVTVYMKLIKYIVLCHDARSKTPWGLLWYQSLGKFCDAGARSSSSFVSSEVVWYDL